MITSGFKLWGSILNTLVGLYLNFNKLSYAQNLFDEIPEQDVVARTTMITAHSSRGNLKRARRVFDQTPIHTRDVVSLWHFVHKMRLNKDVKEPISLEEAFDLFCVGASPYGPYWDHVIGYWKASLDQPQAVMFLRYEDMMQDTILYVKRLAEFVGCPFSYEEEKEGVVSRIVEMCSFESLSNLQVNKNGITPSMLGFTSLNNDRYFRKGKVGNWRNYLSDDMANKIDQITADKLNPLGLQL